MKVERIKEIVVNDKNELLLKVLGQGSSSYQYVYREAAGIYWDESLKAFKSTPMTDWTVSQWFLHIKNRVNSVLNVELSIDEHVKWRNISDEEKSSIKNTF